LNPRSIISTIKHPFLNFRTAWKSGQTLGSLLMKRNRK
jgi:hypothetical protein